MIGERMILINESKFNMWRACVAIVYLDKAIAPEEQKWVEDKILKLPLTNEQRLILKNDLAMGIALEDVLPKITDNVDLGFLVNTFRVLANIDQNFSVDEKEAFQKLETQVLKGLDLNKLESEIQTIEKESYHEREVYKNYSSATILENTFNDFMKWLNPGDYKVPKK